MPKEQNYNRYVRENSVSQVQIGCSYSSNSYPELMTTWALWLTV